MKVYRPEVVKDIELFYGDLLTQIDPGTSIYDHLNVLAVRMWEGVQANNKAVLKEISNYHWRHLGKSAEMLGAAKLTALDCRQAIANEFGFRRWTEVEHLNVPYNLDFEHAINSLLEGDLETLKKQLSKNKRLINCKSSYGHRATLLHYSASNGVEFWRQKVPLNLPQIVAYLVEQGANRKAKMKVYGGEYTAMELLPSSAHPAFAGISEELRKQFER